MDNIIFQLIITGFMVLAPLVGPRTRRQETDFKQQTQIHSIYGVNEDGKLEVLHKEA